MSGGKGYTRKISLPSPQFCCEPKTSLKNKVCLFKNSLKFLEASSLSIEK